MGVPLYDRTIITPTEVLSLFFSFRRILLTFLVIIAAASLPAVEPYGITIKEVIYRIDGNTREDALNQVLDWDVDRVFPGRRELDAYLHDQRQILIKRKIFNSVRSEVTMTVNGNGREEAVVTVILEDSWKIYPKPIYKYDSNLGMITGLGTDYYNFLGTMTNVNIMGYYSPRKSEIELSMEGIRISFMELDFLINQLWDETRYADESGEINLEYSYIQTLAQVSVLFPITRNLDYRFSPTLYWPYAYSFHINDTGSENHSYMKSGTNPALYHMFIFDSVNWIGNLRQGLTASIENGLEYTPGNDRFVTWLDGIFTSFLYTPVINYDSRVSVFWYYNDVRDNSGDRLRGILDYKLSGDWGFYWNQNFVFPVLKLPKITDVHLSPFMDMGFVGNRGGHGSRKDIQYTAGVGLNIFPAPLPNLQLSLDFGINLKDFSETELLINSVLYF